MSEILGPNVLPVVAHVSSTLLQLAVVAGDAAIMDQVLYCTVVPMVVRDVFRGNLYPAPFPMSLMSVTGCHPLASDRNVYCWC